MHFIPISIATDPALSFWTKLGEPAAEITISESDAASSNALLDVFLLH